jgi:hypothetical protein
MFTNKPSLFATQWGYVAVGLAILPFLPESPYWLVARGRIEKARHNIIKLHAPDYDVDGQMAEIHDSLERTNADKEGSASISECFSRQNIRRTMVCTMIFFIQNASGSAWVIGYMSYFMQLGGMSPARSFDTTVGLSGLMVVGNMFGWLFIEWFGRRGTALYGTAILAVTLMLIGVLAVIKTPGAIWGQVAFMAVWSFGKHHGSLTLYKLTPRSLPGHYRLCRMGHFSREFYLPPSQPYSVFGHHYERPLRLYLGFLASVCDQP